MAAETLASLVAWARDELQRSGTETAALDARLLLQKVANVDHGTLIAQPGLDVSDAAAGKYRELIGRRLRREPVSRILGVREFYGRDFQLGPDTLDPRPDTETLIDAALNHLQNFSNPRVLDLGTGTGAIAITLLAELPDATAVATDISAEALNMAKANAVANGVGERLRLIETSWFSGITDCFDVIISNPPYIASGSMAFLQPEVRDWDPSRALDGGTDGLDAYRGIARDAGTWLLPKGQVMVEIGEGQGDQVAEIFENCGLELLSCHADLAGRVRSLVFGLRKMGVGNGLDLGYIPSR